MSGFSQSNFVSQYSFVPAKDEKFDHIPKLDTSHFSTQGTEPIVDLRERMPEVWNQGQIGSCTAHALCAAMAFDDPALIGSRLYVYYNERKMENKIDQDDGAVLSDGVEALHTYGLCPEEYWPYSDDGTKMKEQPPDEAYEVAVAHEACSYHQVNPDEESIKACLASGFPIVLCITLYESFDNVGSDGLVPMPDKATEKEEGGHAVIMVGYDDTRRVWIMRNSWGPDWGDGGHFYLPYAYITDQSLDLCWDLWVITSVSNAPVPHHPTAIKPHRKHRHHHHHHHKHHFH